jgi:L-asparaginase
MTIQDREFILARCQRYSGERIVVIHGTDTMTETATYLAQHDQGHQSIVLTGAMRPVAFGHSDATFNLGFAVAMATLQTKGVYVAMNGVCFAANAVEKNREQGKFQSRDHRLLGEQETR